MFLRTRLAARLQGLWQPIMSFLSQCSESRASLRLWRLVIVNLCV